MTFQDKLAVLLNAVSLWLYIFCVYRIVRNNKKLLINQGLANLQAFKRIENKQQAIIEKVNIQDAHLGELNSWISTVESELDDLSAEIAALPRTVME
jgi:hypothetical protein